MFRHVTKTIVGLTLLILPSWLAAEALPDSVLGNAGEVLTVKAGTYGELFPGGDELEAERPIVTLDILRPGESGERLIVPATLGWEVESSPALLFSKKRDVLNVLWTARLEKQVSLFLARLEDHEWSPVAEIYSNADGVLPTVATTRDVFYYETGDQRVIDVERETLHLVWSQQGNGQSSVAYSPVLLINGALIDWKETFTFSHLDPDANEVVAGRLPAMMRVRASAAEESIAITFGSSDSGRITTLELELVPMEIVFLSDLVGELILESEFDPQNVNSFADTMGAELIGVGSRGRGRGRSHLTFSMFDFVATGIHNRIVETGADYSADEVDLLAADLRRYTMELTQSLLSPAVTAEPQARSRLLGSESKATPILEINVDEPVDEGQAPAPMSHILELRSAVEWAIPDSQGARITVLASDDGLDLVAGWLDADGKKVWYVESKPDLTWSEPKTLTLGEHLTLEKAAALLQARVR